MMAALPLQMSIANQMASNMTGPINDLMQNMSRPDMSRSAPPDLPARPRRCPVCGRELDNTDVFCRYCGNRL